MIEQIRAEIIKTIDRIILMKQYLNMKCNELDWHGVCDASMDLRDLENYKLGLEYALKIMEKSEVITDILANYSDN